MIIFTYEFQLSMLSNTFFTKQLLSLSIYFRKTNEIL